MTVFGSGGAAGKPRGADEEQRITIKDNRRIDRDTLKARAAEEVAPGAADPGSGSGGAVDADLAAARAEAAERTADLQRITAEYANYRKRVDRDKQIALTSGKAAVVAELLGVCDDLDRAQEHGDLVGGFKNVADKFTGILNKLGLSHYGAEGDEFDPNIHEAVQFATSAEVAHPTVTTVLRLGYLFDEKVLRPAVVVVTGPEHGDDAAGDGDGSGGVAGDADAADSVGAADGAGAAAGSDDAAGDAQPGGVAD